MRIVMAGIDISAPFEVREKFAFTQQQALEAMRAACAENGVSGCVILSTCNRSELWVSVKDDTNCDPSSVLCALRSLSPQNYIGTITQRENEKAIRYLFETACGLHSELKWEDQILTQVGAALTAARQAGTADDQLERLFQSATACAKKIKTQVHPSVVSDGASCCAVKIVCSMFEEITNLHCLIIGSGEMGRAVARKFAELGAQVTVTVRSYRHGLSLVPEHCEAVSYDKRYEELRQSDVVVGATRSPHFTLSVSEAGAVLYDGKRRLLIDMAVPRDFDPMLSGIGNTRLFNMDSLAAAAGVTVADPDAKQKEFDAEKQASELIDAAMEEFERWRRQRVQLPLFQAAADAAAWKITRRTEKILSGSLGAPETENDLSRPSAAISVPIRSELQKAAAQTVLSMLMALNESGDFTYALDDYVKKQTSYAKKMI